jgi:hypothetical protein
MTLAQLAVPAIFDAEQVSGHAIAQRVGARVQRILKVLSHATGISIAANRPESVPGEKTSSYICKVLAAIVLACSMQVGSVSAGTVLVDGVMDVDEYDDSFIANWINGHKTGNSIYSDGTDETEVFHTTDSGSLFLYMEVPIYAKNMIWGAGATDVSEYQDQWLTHHKGTFVMDYKAATGSEKAIFGVDSDKYEGELQGTAKGTGITGYATSLDWLFDAGNGNTYGCDTTDCAAVDVTMSFEFQWDTSLINEEALLLAIEEDGIEFHLSPERDGGPPEPPTEVVPVPAAAWLFGSGLGLLGWLRRKIA